MIYAPTCQIICESGRPGCLQELKIVLSKFEPLNTLCERLEDYLAREARNRGWLVEKSGRTVCPACTIKEGASNGKS